jgi:hypothetical protein
MSFLSTTTGRLFLLVAFLALLRLAFLPVGVVHSPPADGSVKSGLITVPPHSGIFYPISVRFQKETVPTICVLMLSPLQTPSEIRLLIFDRPDTAKWLHGDWSGAQYDSKTSNARQLAIPLQPKKDAPTTENYYYVVFANEDTGDKTFLAGAWLDQVPRGMLLYQQAIWLYRFLLFVVAVVIIAAFRKGAPKVAGDVYALPPSPTR